jgi:hypothetical protein
MLVRRPTFGRRRAGGVLSAVRLVIPMLAISTSLDCDERDHVALARVCTATSQ